MSFTYLLQSVISHLTSNKLRTLLTVVGIVIGIASVITILSAGNGLKSFILGELSAFGSDYVVVEVKVPNTSRNSTDNSVGLVTGITITTLTLQDMEDIVKLPEIKTAYAALMGQEVTSYLHESKKTNLHGVSSTFFDIDKSAKLESGEYFTQEQENAYSKVVVLGHDVKDKLFGVDDPLHKKIRIGQEKYTVIGVLQPRGNELFMNMDDTIFMPVTTLQKKVVGVDYVSFIFASANSTDDADKAAEPIRQILRKNHNISQTALKAGQNSTDRDDFSVTTMSESQDVVNTVVGGIAILLIAIAGISLIVGGVGIMNIMYVSIVERTYEIGLRKACGATRRDILIQFLLEAVIITFVGGVIGIVIGAALSYAISFIASAYGFEWPFSLSLFSILLATSFSVFTGLVFGIYPARKAARLDPIVALRKE